MTLDHINNRGNQHRALHGGRGFSGEKLYKFLEKNGFPDGFQVLCFNCNVGKHLNNGRCPHEDGEE